MSSTHEVYAVHARHISECAGDCAPGHSVGDTRDLRREEQPQDDLTIPLSVAIGGGGAGPPHGFLGCHHGSNRATQEALYAGMPASLSLGFRTLDMES